MQSFDGAQGSENPRFERLIAFDIYDGPITGVVFERGTLEPLLFRLESWDESQKQRAFSLSPLEKRVVDAQLAELTQLLQPRWPEWWLQLTEDVESRQKVHRVIVAITESAREVASLVLADDLMSGVEKHLRLSAPDARAEFNLLRHRSEVGQEVSDAPFEAWVRFLEGG